MIINNIPLRSVILPMRLRAVLVCLAIGEHFSEEGVADVILMDRPGHMAAQYSDGAVVALTPRPGDPAPGSARSR